MARRGAVDFRLGDRMRSYDDAHVRVMLAQVGKTRSARVNMEGDSRQENGGVLDFRGIEQGDANGAEEGIGIANLQSTRIDGDRHRASGDRSRGAGIENAGDQESGEANQAKIGGAAGGGPDAWRLCGQVSRAMDRRAEAAADRGRLVPRSRISVCSHGDLPGPFYDFDGVVSRAPWDRADCPADPRAPHK